LNCPILAGDARGINKGIMISRRKDGNMGNGESKWRDIRRKLGRGQRI